MDTFEALWARSMVLTPLAEPMAAAAVTAAAEKPAAELTASLARQRGVCGGDDDMLHVLHYPGMGKPWQYPHLFSKAGLLRLVATFSKVSHANVRRTLRNAGSRVGAVATANVGDDRFYPRF